MSMTRNPIFEPPVLMIDSLDPSRVRQHFQKKSDRQTDLDFQNDHGSSGIHIDVSSLVLKNVKKKQTNKKKNKQKTILWRTDSGSDWKVAQFRVQSNTGVAHFVYATQVCCIHKIFCVCNTLMLHTQNMSRMQQTYVAYAKYVAYATDFHEKLSLSKRARWNIF